MYDTIYLQLLKIGLCNMLPFILTTCKLAIGYLMFFFWNDLM